MYPLDGIVDHGPIYAETSPAQFPVEPWATYSNLIFLAILIYWAWRTRLNIRRHPLIVSGLPVLLVGYVGGTIYHATRSSNLWLFMDFMPIMLLAMAAAFYLWLRVVRSLPLAFLCFLIPFLLIFWFRRSMTLPRHMFISVGYSMQALAILLPAVLHCSLRYPRGWKWLASALGAFAVAITCRIIDSGLGAQMMPMGTHWLWHVFGGISTFCVMAYVYHADLVEEEREKATGDRSASV